jgi:hypothetical protein
MSLAGIKQDKKKEQPAQNKKSISLDQQAEMEK